MMSLRRIFGLMLLFLFFEAVVAVVTTFVWPEVSVFLACLAMTGLAVAVWVIFVLMTRLITRPRTPPSAPAPRPVAPVAPKISFGSDSFSQELGSLVQEADRRLAGTTSSAAGGPSRVATLPLFLVIGGEGAGKTSALMNSGIEPRLLAGEASRDGAAVPTKLCNLWFAEGAVFADLSGRLVTQEPENWEQALRMLSEKLHIPRWKQVLLGRQSESNLKGVVLVYDGSIFVKANDPQRIGAFARMLNDRLQTIGTIFRRDFPVYVVFTKCDAVQYFPEFFSHLSETEARRLVGATLPFIKHRNDTADVYADREGKRLTSYFNRLYMALAEKRMVLLAREDENTKKSTAYEFPRELKKVRGDIVQFLLDVFRPNPLQAGPRLRGFYLSGQRWIARNAGPVAAESTVAEYSVVPKRSDATVFFGSKGPAGVNPVGARPPAMGNAVPKWMFLTDVFHNVVLKDRAGESVARVNTREQMYRNLAFGTVGVLLLILSLIWANSWRNNRELLSEVQRTIQATRLTAPVASDPETVSELESLRRPLVQLFGYERDGAPLSYRWGLYSGKDVTASLDQLYFSRFRRAFMDPMLGALTARFISLSSSSPVADDIYNLLKSYRMMTSGACSPNEKFLNTALVPVWSNGVGVPSEAVGLAERQMQFYVSELATRDPFQRQLREDGKAVVQAQAYLRDLNGPDKIFRALVEQVNREKQSDNLVRYAANYGEVMSGPNSIDAAFTREGWDTMITNIRGHKLENTGEPCVLGESRLTNLSLDAATERDVEDLYIKSYIQHWKAFLAAHHVEPYRSSSDAAMRLRVLADNNRSPLLGLVYMTSRNTDLSSAAGASGVSQVVEQARETVNKGLKSFFNRGGTETKVPTNGLIPATTTSSAKDVMREFQPVQVVVPPANADKWLNPTNQAYVQALEELGSALAALPPRIDSSLPADQEAVNRANKAVDNANNALHGLGGVIPSTAAQVDVDLKALLLEPITYGQRIIKGLPVKPLPPPPPTPEQLAKPVRVQVNRAAQVLCDDVEGIRSKYPFNSSASQEATIQNLNDVFAPNTGALAQFSQLPEVSKAYMRQGRGWAPNPNFPATFSQPFLVAVNNMTDFSDVLYADGSSNPHFDYTLSLDGTGKVPFELDVDGHVIKYNPGKPSIPTKLVWPPVTAAPTKLVLNKTGLTLPVQSAGPWSLFRLLQAADDQNGGLFTFRTVQFAGSSHVPLQDGKGNPVTVQVRVDSPAGNVFSKGYFSKLRCEGWALR